jgi:hypothetical protein
MVAVLFVLLTVAVTFTGIFVFKHGALLTELKDALLVHHRDTAAAIAKIAAIEQNIQAFRDSDKDLLANLREALLTHAKECQSGNARMCDLQKDTDAIGRSVEKLVTVLTIARRRIDDDDGNGKK